MKQIKETKEKSKKSYLFKRLLKYLAPYKAGLFWSFMSQIFLSAMEVLPSVFIGKFIDQVPSVNTNSYGVLQELYYQSIPSNYKLFFYLLPAFCLIVLILGFVIYKKNVWLEKTGQNVILSFRKQIFEHIETMDDEHLHKLPVGKLVTRTVNDTNHISYLFSFLLVDFCYSFVVIGFYIAAMFYTSWRVASFLLIFMVFTATLLFIFRIVSKRMYLDLKEKVAIQNAILSESLSGIKVVKAFNQEKSKQVEFNRASADVAYAQSKILTLNLYFRPLIFLIEQFGKFFVFIYSIFLIKRQLITPGNAFSLFSLLSGFFFPLYMLADQFDTLQNCLSSSEKIFDILDIKNNVYDKEGVKDLTNFKGDIEFKNVWFKYADDEWVLKGVSFKVNPLDSVAIVGPTGAGKSTILKLITKNYIPQEGEILLDGQNIKQLSTKSIRLSIGQMLQDVFLFEGSIKDNLTFGDNIPEAEINQALSYVGADSIVSKYTNGLMQKVTERGGNFSAGERQLLSFARAILSKPKMLFLDEATANIDTETEIKIQESLKNIMQDKTMLVVAHRLSTIKNSKKILLLSDGVIIEQGTHSELIAQKGQYYQLYKLQSKEE